MALKIMRAPLERASEEGSIDSFTSYDRSNVSLARSASLQRFRREAQILAHVEHPGIVHFIDQGVFEPGRLYLAMSWLEGQTLGRRLARGPISVRESATLAVRLGDALGHVHKLGIVHRDIKPSNLFLLDGELEKPVLIDFGVARGYPTTEPETDEGLFLGTVGYVAPEQARGDLDIDARADVFALGCVIFKCLTGRLPFEGNSLIATLGSILLGGAPLADEIVPDLPPRIVDLVARMLSKDRNDRPSHGYAIAQEFQAFLLELESAGPLARSHRRKLGGDEQRVASILAITTADRALSKSGMHAVARAADDNVATALEKGDANLLKAVRSAARPFGAAVRPLVDGTLLVIPAESATAIDQATRAARLALLLQDVPGVHSVAVTTGDVLFVGSAPLGDAVERAVDLVERASYEPWPVFLDDATAELLTGCFDLDRVEGGWLLLRPTTPRATTIESSSGAACLSPMVGRDRELDILLGAFAECRDESIARVVVLNGEAGIGKSRLATEFIATAKAQGDLIEVWGDHSPELCRFESSDVSNVGRGWLQLLEAATRLHPVIFVVDQVNGKDVASASVIDWLLGQLRDRPLFVLVMTRSGDRPLSADSWASRNSLELGLGPLRKKTCVRWIRSALGEDADEPTVERLILWSRGNASCLAELIRAELTGRGNTLPLPIQAMLQARIRERSLESRRVLRAASLFGPVFWREGVMALLGAEKDTHVVDSSLAELERAELICAHGRSRFTNTSEYAFQNELVRRAALSSLTERDRRVGHDLANEWLKPRSN